MKSVFLSIYLIGLCTLHAMSYEEACSNEVKQEVLNHSNIENYCLGAADENMEKEDYDSASWYYLLSGRYEKNIDDVLKHISMKNEISAFGNIAHSYVLLGNFEKAQKMYGQYLNAYERVNEATQEDYALMQRLYPNKKENMAKGLAAFNALYKPLLASDEYYARFEKYDDEHNSPEALKALLKVNEIYLKALKPDHPGILYNYNKIAQLYLNLSDFPSTLHYLKLAQNAHESKYGKDHIKSRSVYMNFGAYYFRLGAYDKALEYLNKTLAIEEKHLDETDYALSTTCATLAAVYDKLGDYEQAIALNLKALNIRLLYDKESYDVATSYNNLGVIYSKMQMPKEAIDYLNKSVVIFEKVLGLYHVTNALNYANLGSIARQIGRYDDALGYYNHAILINEKNYGANHIQTAGSYNGIALVYHTMGKLKEALDYNFKALKVREEVLTPQHDDTIVSYNNLALVYADLHEYKQFLKYTQKAYDNYLKNIDINFVILDSAQKHAYLKANEHYVSRLFEAQAKMSALAKTLNDKEQVAKRIFTDWINYKGAVFDRENAIITLYSSTKDAKLKKQIESLNQAKRELANLYQSIAVASEYQKHQAKIEEVKNTISSIEKKLAKKVDSFSQGKALEKLTPQDIAKSLHVSELYIDFAKVGEHLYLFTLDNEAHVTFKQFNEKESQKIRSYVQRFRENIEDENTESIDSLKALYTLVFDDTLAKQIEEKTDLIISADASLRLLPFEALRQKDGHYLIESKTLRYVPSAKEFVRLHRFNAKTHNEKTVFFSNPNFDAHMAPASKNRERIVDAYFNPELQIQRALFNMYFSPLEGTKYEAESITKLLNNKSVKNYTQKDASEKNLLDLKNLKILHIASHGFFLNDEEIANPMLRSGIALSGANTSAKNGKGEGILTSLKIAGMDLKGCDLVVLSACETGVLDMDASQSVSGLNKAFMQAGSKNMLLSLWSVADKETADLMIGFYTQLKSGSSYANALRASKLEMIKAGMHPYYWSAFILSGL